MNKLDYIVVDFETTSPNPSTCQPVQVSAIAVDSRKLDIVPQSEFNSDIQPIFDQEECKKWDLDPIDAESSSIHQRYVDTLRDAPPLKSVWSNFTQYVNNYNRAGDKFTSPIMVGYNIRGFDCEVVDRICVQKPWGFGPTSRGRQGLFNSIRIVDVQDLMFVLTENNPDIDSVSADNLIRNYMGYTKGIAHDAMDDVIMTAELFIVVMRLMRKVSKKTKFKDHFGE